MAETQEQQATPVTTTAAVTAVTATTEPSKPVRIFPRPVLDNRRRRAVEASLALPGPGHTLEASIRLPSAETGQIELPLVSGAASGALLGLAIGLARRQDGTQPVVAAHARADGR